MNVSELIGALNQYDPDKQVNMLDTDLETGSQLFLDIGEVSFDEEAGVVVLKTEAAMQKADGEEEPMPEAGTDDEENA